MENIKVSESKMPRYSTNFIRDVQFYLQNRHKFTFFGGVVSPQQKDFNGVNGIRAFHIFDSTGKEVSTRHPYLLATLIRTKKAVNFQIKQWSEGIAYDVNTLLKESIDGILDILLVEYMEYCIKPPDWVKKSLISAVKKLFKKSERPS